MSSTTQQIASSDTEADETWIPEGYETVKGPGDIKYIIPEFLFSDLQQRYQSHLMKQDRNAFSSPGTVHESNSLDFDAIGEGMIKSPTVPGSSDRERLAAHSEVLVLQERLGISYKDAAHRLYMAELETVKANQKMFKAFTTLQDSTLKTLKMAYDAINEIDNDEKNN